MDYQARFYIPVLGRFTQPDTVVPEPGNTQAWNRYSYTVNNPIMYNDPSGHIPLIDGLCTTTSYRKVNPSSYANTQPGSLNPTPTDINGYPGAQGEDGIKKELEKRRKLRRESNNNNPPPNYSPELNVPELPAPFGYRAVSKVSTEELVYIQLVTWYSYGLFSTAYIDYNPSIFMVSNNGELIVNVYNSDYAGFSFSAKNALLSFNFKYKTGEWGSASSGFGANYSIDVSRGINSNTPSEIGMYVYNESRVSLYDNTIVSHCRTGAYFTNHNTLTSLGLLAIVLKAPQIAPVLYTSPIIKQNSNPATIMP